MSGQYPLRERRKHATRQAIKEAALRLFAEQGYDATTVENIAEAADLHLQTLYRHFTSKAELAASIDRDLYLRFAAQFEARTVPTLILWRDWVEQTSTEMAREGSHYRKSILNLFAAPNLVTSFLDTWFQYQQLLSEALAADMQVDLEEDPRPMLIAAMLWGGQLLTLRRWIDSRGKRDFKADSLKIVDTVIEQFSDVAALGGEQGCARKAPPPKPGDSVS